MALPIFGTSNYTNPDWKPNPPTRGTSGLILTCLITLMLCVYSALHLNVFDRQCTWWMRCLVKTKWVVVALLAPEFVVFNAWAQRRHALRIARVLRRRSGQIEPVSLLMWLRGVFGLGLKGVDQEMEGDGSDGDSLKGPSCQTFDISHGFLIVMGGLVVDMSQDTDRVWPTWCDSLTITPACIEKCFELDLFDEIDLDFLTKEAISGRSKRDYFTKFITTVQALWFCAQFFVRLAQSLPVSLLELNTFAHSICALATYILWWHKPTDIEDPFVLYTNHSETLRDLCAAQWTLGASGKHYKKQCLYRSDNGSENEGEVTLHSQWEPTSTHGGSQFLMTLFRGRNGITLLPGTGEDWYIFQQTEETLTTRWYYFPRYRTNEQLKIRISDIYPDRNPPAMNLHPDQLIPGTHEHIDPLFRSVEIDKITLARWSRALRTRPFLNNYSVWLRDRQPNFVWPRGLDNETDGTAIADELVKALFTFLLASLCYGGMHMLAWDSGVLNKSGVEETFWKIACLNLIVLGPFAFIVWTVLKFWRGPDAHLTLGFGWSVILGIFTVVAFLAYVLSRVYLVVEVFVVIPYMDPDVYKLPEYAIYWPHVT